MRLRTLPLLFLLITGCSVLGSSGILVRGQANGPKYKFYIEGQDPVSVQNIVTIRKALSVCSNEMLAHNPSFYIRNDEEHFKFKYFNRTLIALAHCCGSIPRKICLRPQNVYDSIIWHEMGHWHAYTLSSPEAVRELYLRWGNIAGSVYKDSNEDCRKDGLVSAYSRANSTEDIAEFYEECMQNLYDGNFNFWKLANNPYLKTDLRYIKKFELLHEYQFFTDKQYAKLKPLFE